MTNFNYQVGGSLPADAPSYIDRQCDRDYYDLLKERKYCYVFNCRQMGKSSLRVRVTHKLQAEGVVCATIDPQKIGVEVTCEQWYASAIRSLVGDLDLKSKFDLRSWIRERELLSPVQRFAEFIETVVLQEIDAPIVIFVEEIDRLLSLKFGMDDFFGLVRSFFEDRPTKPEYNRLTFSFLGVATPTDLIQSDKTSAFNIGYAVEMAGFTLTEALPLMEGLANRVTNPRDYLAEAVMWSGGQPFLIQRLLGIIRQELAEIAPPENVALWVENLVQERVVANWESQDTPPHLTTIRDRVLSVEEKLRGRMLGCYQQVLADGELDDDRSEERSKLRLTGLVVRRDGRLVSYNPIYGAVFDNAWVEGQLADLRPEFYGSAFREWRESDEQKEAFLLRGQALVDAEAWAKGKRLSDKDDRFLRDSREVEKQEIALSLEAERLTNEKLNEANETLNRANETAKRRIGIGSLILAGTVVAAVLVIFGAKASVDESNRKVNEAKEQSELANRKKAKSDIMASDALNRAKKSDEEIKKTLAYLKVAQFETVQAQAEKKRADEAVEKAKEDLAKLADEAQFQLAEAKLELDKAEESRQIANTQVALAELRLEIVNTKVAFFDNRGIESLLLALRSVKKLKLIDLGKSITERLDLTTALIQAIYSGHEINRLEGENSIDTAAFSYDGTKILTISDGIVRVWNANRTFLFDLKGDQNDLKSGVFSPDGKKIVVASSSGVVWIWDVNGKFLNKKQAHNGRINSIVFSADSKKIVTASDDGFAKVWDSTCGCIFFAIEVGKDKSSKVKSATFSPDGTKILTASDNGFVMFWDSTGKFLSKSQVDDKSISSAVFSPDSTKIVTVSNSIVKVWNSDCECTFATIPGNFFYSATFSPDSTKIITTSDDGTLGVGIWNTNGNLLFELKGHRGAVRSAMFSPDGTKIITASDDSTARIWDAKGLIQLALPGSYSAAFSKDGTKIATGSTDGTANIWDPKGNRLFKLTGHGGHVIRVNFSPDGTKIVTASSNGIDGIVRVWDINGNFLFHLKENKKYVRSVNFSFDGTKIITAADDGTVRLWNAANGKLTFDLKVTGVTNANLSNDGTKIITASIDGIARVWDINGKLLFILKGQNGTIWGANFSPDGMKIATASEDGTVWVWDIRGKFLFALKGHKGKVSSAKFSPDSSKIVTASDSVRVWDSTNGHLIFDLKRPQQNVYNAVFSNDGTKIVAAGLDTSVFVWDVSEEYSYDLDHLSIIGCERLKDYLSNNPNATDSDRQMCGIPPRQK